MRGRRGKEKGEKRHVSKDKVKGEWVKGRERRVWKGSEKKM